MLNFIAKKVPAHKHLLLAMALGVVFVILSFVFTKERTIEFAQAASLVSTVQTTSPSPVATHSWSWSEKIKEADDLLRGLPLTVGTKDITYFENRISRSESGKLVVTSKKISDPERKIGLVLLNTQTGDLRVAVVTKRGSELIGPSDLNIEIVERSNGIRWNLWNTNFKVSEPYVVIRNAWPETENVKKTIRDAKGRRKTITERIIKPFIYSPYSEDLHVSELVAEGRIYLQTVYQEANLRLSERSVMSRAFPNQFVAESLASHCFGCIERLPLLEQTDFIEFVGDARKNTERVWVLFGANREVAFAKTGSSANALGAFQYTSPTWKSMRKIYPKAQLPEFSVGAPNHVASAMAAILLHDYNMANLMKEFGNKIADDPKLEEYLAAAYNGAPRHVTKSLTATLSQKLDEWGIHLKTETKQYMVKIREIHKLLALLG